MLKPISSIWLYNIYTIKQMNDNQKVIKIVVSTIHYNNFKMNGDIL